MKIVGWAEFRTLPAGTVFQEWKTGCLEDLNILGKTYDHGDFGVAKLTPECAGPLFEGTYVVHTPTFLGRDGKGSVEDRKWLVWTERDCQRLAGWLLDPATALKALGELEVMFEVPR